MFVAIFAITHLLVNIWFSINLENWNMLY